MTWRSRWIAPLVFLILPLLPLWKTLLGQTIGPTDQIRQMLPWRGASPSQPWDVLQADGVLQFLPWRDLVLDAWSKHQVPLWNNYELAGTPLLANSQSAGLYPPHILLGLLHLPTALAIVLLAWFHLSWAGLGTYKLCRSLGGSKLGAYIAGISFSLAPFMLAWTALGSVIETVSWIPWVLYALYEVSDRRFVGLLGVAAGMMLLAGHLQFAFYGLIAAGIVVAVIFLNNLASKDRSAWSTLGTSVAGLALGLMLSGAQLLPVLQYGKLSDRQNVPTEQGYNDYIRLSVKPFELGALANPAALGYPRDSASDSDPSISTYWPMWVKNGANYAESAITIGPFILALLGLVAWKDRKLLPLIVLAAISFLLALGTILNKVLFFGIPGWSATGSPGRIEVLFVLAACVLGGSAVVDRPAKPARPILIAVASLLLVGVFLSLYAPMLAPSVPAEAKTVEAIQAAASFKSLLALLGGVLLAATGMSLLLVERLAKFRWAALAIPILFCGLFFGLDLVTTGTPLAPIETPPVVEARVAYINQNWSPLKVSSDNNTVPNIASLNRVHELGGYDSLVSGETVKMLKDVNGGDDPAPPLNGNMMFIKTANLDKLKDAGVSFVGTPTGLEPIPNAPGRCSLSGGTATITAEDYSSLTVQANGPGVLTVRDRLLPGWTAKLDGNPVEMPSGTWRTVQIAAPGTDTVRFSYSPPGYSLGIVLSFVALLCLALVGLPFNRIISSLREDTEDRSVT